MASHVDRDIEIFRNDVQSLHISTNIKLTDIMALEHFRTWESIGITIHMLTVLQ